MKMMLTVKAYLEVMMLHQIGRKSRWCQQKSNGIEERCWHQRRILPRWCSIFSRLPSHHHEKASIWYSIGMSGDENHLHAYPPFAWNLPVPACWASKTIILPTIVYSHPGYKKFEASVFRKFAFSESYAIRLFHSFLSWWVYDIKSRHCRPVLFW